MMKFDFTSHFIIVLCLMVILVSTLVNNKFFRKFKMKYRAFYVICPTASSQYVTPLLAVCIESALTDYDCVLSAYVHRHGRT